MAPIPIRMPSVSVHLHADPRLAFQVITAFGSSSLAEGANSPGKTRVLRREDGRLLVEFHTAGRNLLGRRKTYRTVEWVTLQEPDRIDFDGVEGPLALLCDRFDLADDRGCTLLAYHSTFGLKAWVAGWLFGILVVRPMLGRMMREHLAELKVTIEARARRSKVSPWPPCGLEDVRVD